MSTSVAREPLPGPHFPNAETGPVTHERRRPSAARTSNNLKKAVNCRTSTAWPPGTERVMDTQTTSSEPCQPVSLGSDRFRIYCGKNLNRSDLAKKARERKMVGSLKPFRWNPAGNQSRPVEPDQQPEASLAWWVGETTPLRSVDSQIKRCAIEPRNHNSRRTSGSDRVSS